MRAGAAVLAFVRAEWPAFHWSLVEGGIQAFDPEAKLYACWLPWDQANRSEMYAGLAAMVDRLRHPKRIEIGDIIHGRRVVLIDRKTGEIGLEKRGKR